MRIKFVQCTFFVFVVGLIHYPLLYERQVRDLGSAGQRMRGLPYVDGNGLALMGDSIGGDESAPSARAQTADDSLAHDQAVADLQYLCSLMERVHPDPYSAFGGRVAFKRRFYDEAARVPGAGLSLAEFAVRVSSLLAEAHDGHTAILLPTNKSTRPGRLAARLKASTDEVFVTTGSGPRSRDGARLRAVNGVTIEELLARVERLRPLETVSAARQRLVTGLSSAASVVQLLPAAGDALELAFVDARGARRAAKVAYDQSFAGTAFTADHTINRPHTGLVRTALLAHGRIGYLGIPTIFAREAFEMMRASKLRDSEIERFLGSIYRNYLHVQQPADRDSAIRGVPSMIEAVRSLQRDMTSSGATALVVDLRGNDGGWSPISAALLYQLYGAKYLSEGDRTSYLRQLSKDYLDVTGATLDQQPAPVSGWIPSLGDLVFDAGSGPETSEQFLSRLSAEEVSAVDTLRSEVQNRPTRVAVLTDGVTFSAAFDLMYDLWRLGAITVGEPPAQSPVSFTEAQPFTLPHSQLRGSISRGAVVHPRAASMGREFRVDYPMRWRDYRAFGFREDAALEQAIAVLSSKRSKRIRGGAMNEGRS